MYVCFARVCILFCGLQICGLTYFNGNRFAPRFFAVILATLMLGYGSGVFFLFFFYFVRAFILSFFSS